MTADIYKGAWAPGWHHWLPGAFIYFFRKVNLSFDDVIGIHCSNPAWTEPRYCMFGWSVLVISKLIVAYTDIRWHTCTCAGWWSGHWLLYTLVQFVSSPHAFLVTREMLWIWDYYEFNTTHSCLQFENLVNYCIAPDYQLINNILPPDLWTVVRWLIRAKHGFFYVLVPSF